MALTVKEIWAGHYQHAGSDKIWAGALVLSDAGELSFRSCWGKRGSSLQGSFDASVKAEANYQKKVKEKIADGYASIVPNQYGIWETLGLSAVAAPLQSGVLIAPPPKQDANYQPRVVVSHLTAIKSATELGSYLSNPTWGMTEKVNGVRFVVEWTGDAVIGYNRKGERQFSVPEAAQSLRHLQRPVLVDGERLDGMHAEEYVAFDLLEVDGRSVRNLSFIERADMLARMFSIAGLAAPKAYVDHLKASLHLLQPAYDPATKRSLLKWLDESGREGVVFRMASGASQAGNTKVEVKWKFLVDLDAIILGTNLAKGVASVRLGLLRPSDGAIIEIGSVRSGLTDRDVSLIQGKMHEHDFKVKNGFLISKIGFLRARTISTQLVEPTMHLSDIRDDKTWQECTTDQLVEIYGPSRVDAIELAEPWGGFYGHSS